MRRCEEFRDAMAAEAAGEIEAGSRISLLAHLDGCPRCARDAALLREALSGLRSGATPEPGPVYWASFGERLRARIETARRVSAWRSRLLAAAVLVAVIGAGVLATLRRPGGTAPGGSDPSPAPAVATGALPGSAPADARPGGRVTTGGADEAAAAEARLDAVLGAIHGGSATTAAGDLERLLDEIAPGDPFAVAGGWDDGDVKRDSGV